jgi:hypothetical protein
MAVLADGRESIDLDGIVTSWPRGATSIVTDDFAAVATAKSLPRRKVVS